MYRSLVLTVLLALAMGSDGCAQKKGQTMDWFLGKDLALQKAIDQDNVAALHAALTAGANVNAKGRVAVNPLEYALSHFKKLTYAELLKLHADPNQRDGEGDTAVTLAVRAYGKDPEYLSLALQHGGDPNTRRSDTDPVLVSFMASRSIAGIRQLSLAGADVNARDRTGTPLVVSASLTQDWDVVLCLLQLGAKFDYSGEPYTVAAGFKNYRATPPDSPLYGYKQQSYQFLVAHGMALPPLVPR